jgi:hypothetical protein
MIWFWAVLGAVAIGFFLRFMALTKGHVLTLQANYQNKFFEYANQIADWEDISDARLRTLSSLSLDLRSRKMQIWIVNAVQIAIKNDKAGKRSAQSTRESFGDLSDDQRATWKRMYFRWIIAVCAQGSVLGVGALVAALEYFDPEDTDKITMMPNLQLETTGVHLR